MGTVNLGLNEMPGPEEGEGYEVEGGWDGCADW